MSLGMRKDGRVIFVDLGANIGTHALPIAARYVMLSFNFFV